MSRTPLDVAELLSEDSDVFVTPPLATNPMIDPGSFLPQSIRNPAPPSDDLSLGAESGVMHAAMLDRVRDGLQRNRRKEIPVRSVPREPINPLCKKLFDSTAVYQGSSSSLESVQSLINRIQLTHDIDVARRALEKESHEERLRGLRDLQKLCDKENWMYRSVEDLLGFK